jgi:hypothetical protein
MSIRGKWRIVEMPDYEADFPDMMGPAYILFDKTGGEFAFGCVTGAMGLQTEMRSSSLGPATTKWTKPAAMDGPSSKPMAPSKDRFASKAAMKPTS